MSSFSTYRTISLANGPSICGRECQSFLPRFIWITTTNASTSSFQNFIYRPTSSHARLIFLLISLNMLVVLTAKPRNAGGLILTRSHQAPRRWAQALGTIHSMTILVIGIGSVLSSLVSIVRILFFLLIIMQSLRTTHCSKISKRRGAKSRSSTRAFGT